MRRDDLIWMTCSIGLAGCGGSPGDADASIDANEDTSAEIDAPAHVDVGGEGRWMRCCVGDLAIPGIQSRGSGDSLECLCPAGATCNYGQCYWFDSGPPVPAGDSGFADAGPIDDAAIDALLTDDAASTDDAVP